MKIRLDKLLVDRGLAASRERAQALILAGRVLANEQKIDKKKESYFKRPRMSWTGDLQQKFLEAIDIVGGPKSNLTILKYLVVQFLYYFSSIY